MTLYQGYIFYVCLVIALLPAVVLGIMGRNLKNYCLFISIVFIGLAMVGDVNQLVSFVFFFCIELFIAKGYLVLRKKYGRNEKLYYLAVFLSIMPLVLNKVSAVFSLNVFGILGISYVTFRTVQIVIETYDGIIVDIPTLEYAGFILFFPSLSSGPIDRSRRFHEDWDKVYSREEYLEMVSTGILKILVGMIYKLILAVEFYKMMNFFDGDKWYFYIGYGYLYGFYLFFDFAGYSLMAIGTSYILGIKTPDNFKRPFMAINIQEFWNCWHITLSHWFRDFIFSRFIMKCVKNKWFSTRLQRASMGFIVNMLIMGMWHGLTPAYLIYGLYHGVLLAINEVYQKKSQFYKKNKDKKIYKFIS
ncbi:MAG: D-alanyl-lipoteichoic acid biosynthesis protein DltB [Aminipila sp.]